jgi:HSP20 family protein
MRLNGFPFALNNEIDRLFRDLTPRPAAAETRVPVPVDVREEGDRIVLVADLPGTRPEDVKLTFENGVLTLAGERREPASDKTPTFHRKERVHGLFERHFKLSPDIDGDKVEATFEHGVLTITMPRRPETRPRHIEIRTAK